MYPTLSLNKPRGKQVLEQYTVLQHFRKLTLCSYLPWINMLEKLHIEKYLLPGIPQINMD